MWDTVMFTPFLLITLVLLVWELTIVTVAFLAMKYLTILAGNKTSAAQQSSLWIL